MARNPIPADQSHWDVYGKLAQDDLAYLHGLLENAAAATTRDAPTQKIGDFYATCMDEAAIDRRGVTPIAQELDTIAKVTRTAELPALLAKLFPSAPGMVFGLGAGEDPDDSSREMLTLEQSGLGLPEKEYYTKSDAKSVEIRDHYRAHVAATLVLLGDSVAAAQREAGEVYAIEAQLAEASLAQVDRRDPYASI